MRTALLIAGAVLALTSTAGAANAAVVYSETFDAPEFVGLNLGLLPSELNSDRWADTTYYNINNFNNWTFSGTTAALAQQTDTSDGALLLNEPSGAATTTITGLTNGQSYALTFLLSGDNRAGSAYVLDGSINGNPFSYNGVDLAPGTNPGTLETVYFTATGSTATLSFSQASITEASPIVDNILVSSVPEASTWAMMLIGFGAVGAGMRMSRRKSGAVART